MTAMPAAPGSPAPTGLGWGAAVTAGVFFVVEAGLTFMGLSADVEQPAFRVAYGWSTAVGALLLLALVAGGLARSVAVVTVVAVAEVVRLVAVPVLLAGLGWHEPDGSSGAGTLFALGLNATVLAGWEAYLAFSVRRRLRPRVRGRR